MDDVVAEQGDLDPFRAQVGCNLPCLGQDDGHEERERWQGVKKQVPENTIRLWLGNVQDIGFGLQNI